MVQAGVLKKIESVPMCGHNSGGEAGPSDQANAQLRRGRKGSDRRRSSKGRVIFLNRGQWAKKRWNCNGGSKQIVMPHILSILRRGVERWRFRLAATRTTLHGKAATLAAYHVAVRHIARPNRALRRKRSQKQGHNQQQRKTSQGRLHTRAYRFHGVH
jgi:hypothetical protein